MAVSASLTVKWKIKRAVVKAAYGKARTPQTISKGTTEAAQGTGVALEMGNSGKDAIDTEFEQY